MALNVIMSSCHHVIMSSFQIFFVQRKKRRPMSDLCFFLMLPVKKIFTFFNSHFFFDFCLDLYVICSINER